MDLTRWLLRMAYWARRPPSRPQVMVILAVAVIAIVLVGIERTVGWPDWLTVNKPVKMFRH